MINKKEALDPLVLMDINEIKKRIPHRYPMLLVDRIIEIDPGKGKIVGLKAVSVNEPYFEGHFPEQPVMPGVLILEAMAQTACLLVSELSPDVYRNTVFLTAIDKARFRQLVVPGDLICLEVFFLKSKMGSYKFSGKALVNGKVAAQAEIMAQAG